jgi:hypothetical protein
MTGGIFFKKKEENYEKVSLHIVVGCFGYRFDISGAGGRADKNRSDADC